MADSDYEDDFIYEDDDQDEEPDVDVENGYYNAKAMKEEEPHEALKEFRKVIETEQEAGEKGDWGFKSLKQMVKICFSLNDTENALLYYNELLTYTTRAVTRNYSEKSINNILDKISLSSDMAFMERFYSITLTALEEQRNDRLWLKTNLKLAKLWLDRQEYGRLGKSLRQLHQACQTDEGEDDQSKGTHLLEVYALEIQMYTETKNNKKLKELYNRSLRVKSAIPHPRIMGVIRECGGKMHMSEGDFVTAQQDFFESFRNFDEAGSLQRIQVLKYLVLAHMLMESDIDPFDSQETKPYKEDPQIRAMNSLLQAYQEKNIPLFQKILVSNGADILSDPFIRTYINTLLRAIRNQVIIEIIKPYKRIELSYLAKTVGVSEEEVEDLVVGLILDQRIRAQVDRVGGLLVLEDSNGIGDSRYEALRKWVGGVDEMWRKVVDGALIVDWAS